MDGGSPRCHTTAGEPPPIVCPAPQSWAHSTHPAGRQYQLGGSPKGVRCVFLVPSGPGDSGRGCSEYPNSGLRSGFLFVPSRTRVQNLRRISSPSVSDGTRVLMRKNVQSNHRTYSVNVWIKVGRECRRPPRNCSSDVLRTGRAFAGRENQLSSISRHCSGVLPCCRQFDHRTWGWFGGFVTVGVLVVVRGVPAVGGASVIPASARGSGKVIPSELVHVVPSQDPPLAVISLTRLIAAGPAHSSVQPYVPSVNAVFGPGEVQ